MNNFADEDDVDAEEEREESAIPEPADVEEKTYEPLGEEDIPVAEEPPGRFAYRKELRVLLRAGLGLLIIGTAISIRWSLMPDVFDVEQVARARAEQYGHREPDQALPRGYRTTSVIIHLADQLLRKPGGYLSNDWNPMSRIPDNMRNWEYGCVVQLRVMVQGLRFELSRAGPQSQEREELREAESRFNFTHTSLVLPSTERQYREGIQFLETYLDGLNSARSEGLFFTLRQDQIILFLGRQKLLLGDYASQLQRNVGELRFDVGALTEELGRPPPPLDPDAKQDVNGFFERDDVFYRVRGGVYVMYHVMLALRVDAEEMLNDTQSMGVMNRLLNELESACKPMVSPMVLNGPEFGVIQNHSLVLGAHVAKAHLAVQELQRQMAGGGGN